jgi:hypothetical protein
LRRATKQSRVYRGYFQGVNADHMMFRDVSLQSEGRIGRLAHKALVCDLYWWEDLVVSDLDMRAIDKREETQDMYIINRSYKTDCRMGAH